MKPSGRHENKPLVVKHDGKAYIRSTNFAKVFEREHKSVLDSIKRRQNLALFLPSKYKNSQQHEFEEFLISEEGLLLLTQKYTSEDQQKRIRQYQKQFEANLAAQKHLFCAARLQRFSRARENVQFFAYREFRMSALSSSRKFRRGEHERKTFMFDFEHFIYTRIAFVNC